MENVHMNIEQEHEVRKEEFNIRCLCHDKKCHTVYIDTDESIVSIGELSDKYYRVPHTSNNECDFDGDIVGTNTTLLLDAHVYHNFKIAASKSGYHVIAEENVNASGVRQYAVTVTVEQLQTITLSYHQLKALPIEAMIDNGIDFDDFEFKQYKKEACAIFQKPK